MSNISITQRCNRGCTYCFAEDVMKSTPGAGAFMNWEEFEESLNFLERSGITEATLLGGEPTIHPHFCEMVDRALARGFRVLVLSGGIIPEKSLVHIEEAAPGHVAVMLNVVPPGETFSQRERDKQAEVMRRIGPQVALGLNIDHPATPLNFLLEWIDAFSLERVLRLGLAHPIAGGHNAFLHARDYPEVGRRVTEFAFRAREASVHIEFDCGWVPCMFPNGALAELGITPQQVGLRCNPILDVLPGRQTISCYPLASLAREPLPADKDAAWLAGRFAERISPYRPMMLYRHCASCDWLARGECTGGCVAGSMRRLRTAESTTRSS
jgi:hypothetical protein